MNERFLDTAKFTAREVGKLLMNDIELAQTGDKHEHMILDEFKSSTVKVVDILRKGNSTHSKSKMYCSK